MPGSCAWRTVKAPNKQEQGEEKCSHHFILVKISDFEYTRKNLDKLSIECDKFLLTVGQIEFYTT